MSNLAVEIGGALWCFVGLCGALWGFVVLCGALWCFVGLCGALWCFVLSEKQLQFFYCIHFLRFVRIRKTLTCQISAFFNKVRSYHTAMQKCTQYVKFQCVVHVLMHVAFVPLRVCSRGDWRGF